MKNEHGTYYSAPDRFSGSAPIEKPLSETIIQITPEMLIADNHSSFADERRAIWEEARDNNRLSVIWACSDARLLLPDQTSVHVRTIAAGGPREPFERLIRDKKVQDIVVLAHHDGDTVDEGVIPGGCGGLDAKASLSNGNSESNSSGIMGYVEEHINHPDVIRQAYKTAQETSLLTDKPVLAATQDHLTGRIYPIAAFWDEGRRAASAVPFRYMEERFFDPERVYADGIPQMSPDMIPSNFEQFLLENKKQAKILHDKYPDYRKTMKVQDPPTATVNAGIRPHGVTQPETLRDPGLNFNVTISRDRVESTIHIADEVVETAADQLEYPITHTVAHFDTPGTSFANLNTVLIVTPDLDQSHRVGKTLKNRSWMRDWITLPHRQILIAQKEAGIMNRIEVLE